MGYKWLLERRDAVIQKEKEDALNLKSMAEKRKKSAESKKRHDALLMRYSDADFLSELFGEPISRVFTETKLCDLGYFKTESELTPDIFAKNTDHFIIGEVKVKDYRGPDALNQITDYSEVLSRLGAPHKCAIFCGNFAQIINTEYSLYSKPVLKKY